MPIQKVVIGLIVWISLGITGFAQNFQLKGTVTDTDSIPLESATVFVEKASDSSLVSYSITNKDGAFEISAKSNATAFLLNISYTGFKTYRKQFSIPENKNIDFGKITLTLDNNRLDEVIVTSTRAPVTVKTDTLEFNAASFKTREDANLEELLKELPGVQVDSDGNITVNGKEVSRILVNGQDFFGDDPKIATKNLPKELINKIQVVDTKTKSEEFTGKEGDSENKTINITIDEDKNKGLFARLTAGGGTNERYETSGIANYFNDKLRVSVLGGANNINASGFSFDEVFDAMGRSAYSVGRNNSSGGITKSETGGANFVNEWDKNAELSANYFFNRANTRTETTAERENILPDRHYFNNSTTSSTRQNDNHRARLGFEIQPDTLTRISFRPNFTVNKGFSSNKSFTESFEDDETPINNAETNRFTEVFSTNFSNQIDLTRKFGNQGGFVRVGFDNKNTTSEEENNYYSLREIFDAAGNLEETEEQDQHINENNQEDQYALSAGARLPLSEVLSIDVDYEYTKTKSKNERLVYDKNMSTANYDELNENLSNDFTAETFEHNPRLGLVYNNENLRAGFSGGIQNIRLKNRDLFSETSFDNTYNNLFTNAYIRYKISETKKIYFNYRNSRNTPSVNQLQPVTNTTNPLNIVTGNPDLEPSLQHRFYGNFNNYNFENKTGFFAYMRGTFTNNQVVPITLTDQDLVRTTTYTNIDGAYNLQGGATIDKTYESAQENSLRLSLGINGSINRNLGFSNGEEYRAITTSVAPRLGVQYDIKELLTIEPNYTLTSINADYSLNNNRQEDYINHNVGIQTTSYWPENLVFGNDISYQHIGNTAPGFKNNFLLWNISLGYKILNDNGIAKIKVFDVLDQNISTSRNTGEDFIQDTQQLVLEQYLMFSFTYNFNKFGGKKQTNRPRRRGRF